MKPCLFLSLCICLATPGWTQNQAPQISSLEAEVDWSAARLYLQFDLEDAESDSLEIVVEVSDDGGHTYALSDQVIATGDVGFPVMPGAGKFILCDISALSGLNPALFTARVSVFDKHPLDPGFLVGEVDSSRLFNDLLFVEGIRHRGTGPAHLQAVRDSISNHFASLNLPVSFQGVPSGGYTGVNIIGDMPGFSTPEEVVIVDAHYDSYFNAPGADDNGSGVVGFMEIARILSPYPATRTLRYIGFDLEEDGLVGSIRYVLSGLPPQESVKGVLNFEMIGYYNDAPNSQQLPAGFNILFPGAYNEVASNDFRGDFIANVGNTNSSPLSALFDSMAAAYVPDLRVVSLLAPGNSELAPDLRRSDHTPFWEAGIQALMLTDGANFRNQCYHTPKDTLVDKLSVGFMANVVRATLATAASLAGVRNGSWKTVGFAPSSGQEEAAGSSGLQLDLLGGSPVLLHIHSSRLPLGDTRVLLYDTQGRLIFSQSYAAGGERELRAALPGVSPGYYIARVVCREGQVVRKLFLH